MYHTNITTNFTKSNHTQKKRTIYINAFVLGYYNAGGVIDLKKNWGTYFSFLFYAVEVTKMTEELTEEALLNAKIIAVDWFRDAKTGYGNLCAEYIIIEKDGVQYKVSALFQDNWNPLIIEKQ